MKTYSVGKRPWCWADSKAQAERIREEDGKTRLGVYEWDAKMMPDDTMRVWNPKRVS